MYDYTYTVSGRMHKQFSIFAFEEAACRAWGRRERAY